MKNDSCQCDTCRHTGCEKQGIGAFYREGSQILTHEAIHGAVECGFRDKRDGSSHKKDCNRSFVDAGHPLFVNGIKYGYQ